jgi:hypothetical protein
LAALGSTPGKPDLGGGGREWEAVLRKMDSELTLEDLTLLLKMD